ncbi:MAG: pyridoxal phosphate-dependent aminotransferase, partial [Domibacillus tundrae]
VVPGSVFGEGGEGYIRCSYASSMSQLQEAVKRISRFLEKRKGRAI